MEEGEATGKKGEPRLRMLGDGGENEGGQNVVLVDAVCARGARRGAARGASRGPSIPVARCSQAN